MSKTTLNIMCSVERRLNKYADLETTHCGHEELAKKASESRKRFLKYIEKQVETLVNKAGLP